MKKTDLFFSLKCTFFSFLCLVLIQPVFSETDFFSGNSSVSAVDLYNQGIEFFDEKNWLNASEKFQEALQKNSA